MTPRRLTLVTASLAAIVSLSLFAYGCGGGTASTASTSSAKIRAAAGSPDDAWRAAVSAVCKRAREDVWKAQKEGPVALALPVITLERYQSLRAIAAPPGREAVHESLVRAARFYAALTSRFRGNLPATYSGMGDSGAADQSPVLRRDVSAPNPGAYSGTGHPGGELAYVTKMFQEAAAAVGVPACTPNPLG